MIKDYAIIKSLLIEDEKALSTKILEEIALGIKSECLALYFLSLTTGKFELFNSCGDSKCLVGNQLSVSPTGISGKCEQLEHEFLEDKLTFFITRKNSCVGLLEMHIKPSKEPPDDIIDKFENISTLLLVVYERKFINRMLKSIQKPINFEAIGPDEFIKNIIEIIKESSGMQLIALRELTKEGDLNCLAVSGFGDIDISKFNFTDNDIPNEFLEVITGNKTVAVSNAREVKWIEDSDLLKDVQSFIAIPIRVGKDVFGVLSFATTVHYYFSSTEILALESIANGIGVSIMNYRNFNASKIDIAKYRETAMALTGLEIAQATRHEAKDKVDNCQFILANLLNAKKEKINDRMDDLRELASTLDEVVTSLNKIKTATRPPEKIKAIESIRVVWDQARSALSGRLSSMNINTNFNGKDTRIEMYSEWLRHVFLNLLLNSMDAFKRGGKRRGKTISLTVEKFSSDFRKLSMVYQDNAGGIDIANLEIPEECLAFSDNMNRLIFAPNVTSKGAEGSGWGLFLVRKSIKYHNGSIDLINHRGGVSFKIELYKEIPEMK